MENKIIRCCKCHEYNWKTSEDAEKRVYTDARGQEYCLFHAPKHEKKDSSGKPMSLDMFNNRLFKYVEKRWDDSNNISCNISGTVFPGNIDFAAHFSKSKCLETISLQHSVFSGNANFSGLTIKGLSLEWATFRGEVDFRGAKFEDEPALGHLTFHSRAYFEKAEFKKGCCFTGSIFDDAACFKECIFGGKMIFHSIKASRNGLRMHKLTKESLSSLIFSSLEAPHFSFKECPDWPRNFGFESEERTSKLTLEELYRAMKQKALEEHDQPQVSRWHFREKEMQLKQLFNNKSSNDLIEVVEDREAKWEERAKAWFKLLWHRPHWPKFTLTGIYWATSGFGERAVRAGLCLVVLVLLSFVFNSSVGHSLWQFLNGLPGAPWVVSVMQNIGDATNATAAMEYIPFTKEIRGDGWVKVGRGFWQFLIAVQFTLFALAVRNRFRR